MSAGVKITVNLEPMQKIKLRHMLDEGGKGQKFFTHQVRRMCDPYVPLDKGPLKNTAEEHDTYIEYVQPYAAKNYYENAGRGTQGTTKHNSHNVHCLRGRLWDKRMMADHGNEVIDSVANYLGGRAKR